METTARMGGFFISSPRMGEADARMGRTEHRMEEQNVEQAEQTEEPQGSEVDWKAESRKWEKYAKENKAAKEELDKLKAERMSESEKLQARAEKAERELAELTAERDRAAAAKEVSESTGVPADLLLFCSDKERMQEFAALYAKEAHVPSAPKKQASRIVREAGAPTSNRDVFAEMMSNL